MPSASMPRPAPAAFRPIYPDDISAVSHLAARIWRQHYPGIISGEQIEYMLQKMYAPDVLAGQLENGHEFWLAEYNNQPAGFACAQQTGPGRWFLHKFYIDQDVARGGIGSALMGHLLSTYAPHELLLHVNRKNTNAINFYFKHGFTIDGLTLNDIGRGFVMDDFRMKRTA